MRDAAPRRAIGCLDPGGSDCMHDTHARDLSTTKTLNDLDGKAMLDRWQRLVLVENGTFKFREVPNGKGPSFHMSPFRGCHPGGFCSRFVTVCAITAV
jgi:hypothetical protein